MNLRTLFLLSLLVLTPAAVFAQENFVPLSGLPGIPETVDSSTLTDFLNNLYKICIGVAAALAVFQIMHGGIKFMTNKGSISENEQARSLIQGAVLGLILVLSPVIVFGIINPRILELNFDTSRLQTTTLTGDVAGPGEDEELIDPEAPYVQYAFLRYFWDDTRDDMVEHYVNNCAPDSSPVPFLDRPDFINAPSSIPSTLEYLIEDYENELPKEESCTAGQEQCVDGKRWRGKCEALSHDIAVYNLDRGSIWQPVPDGHSDRISREFTSGCTRDQGRVVRKADVVTVSASNISVWNNFSPFGGDRACSSEERAAITAAGVTGEPRCKQMRLMCHQE